MQFLVTRMRVVDHLAFAADGRRLFAAGTNTPDLCYQPDNRGIDVFELGGPTAPAERWFPDDLINGLVVNPGGRWLYAGVAVEQFPDRNGREGYWAVDLMDGTQTRFGITFGAFFVLVVHPTGEWLVGYDFLPVGHSTRLVRWRQPADGPPVVGWTHKSRRRVSHAFNLACDPDGSRVVAQSLQGSFGKDSVYKLLVHSPANGRVTGTVPIPGRTVHQLLFSPDGVRLVVRAGPSFLVWNGCDLTEKPRKVKGTARGNFTGLAFHPSGRYLAATSNDQAVALYDTTTWQVARTFRWDLGRMRSVAFSPDGQLAAAGSDTGRVVVWDVDL